MQDGKVRALGVSNLDRDQTERFRQVAPVRTVQPPYNLFEREVERDLLPYAKESGLAVLAYGALWRGLLSGRMSSATRFDGDDLRRVDPKFQQPRFNQYLAAVSALDRFARANFGKSVLALAARWLLDRGPTIALWGARRPEQFGATVEVTGWSLDEPAMRELDRILGDTVTSPSARNLWRPGSGGRTRRCLIGDKRPNGQLVNGRRSAIAEIGRAPDGVSPLRTQPHTQPPIPVA